MKTDFPNPWLIPLIIVVGVLALFVISVVAAHAITSKEYRHGRKVKPSLDTIRLRITVIMGIILVLACIGSFMGGMTLTRSDTIENYKKWGADISKWPNYSPPTTTTTPDPLDTPTQDSDPSWVVHAQAWGHTAYSGTAHATLRTVSTEPGDTKGTTRVTLQLCAKQDLEISEDTDGGFLDIILPHGYDDLHATRPGLVIDKSPTEVRKVTPEYGLPYLVPKLLKGDCTYVRLTLPSEFAKRTYLVFRSVNGEVRQGTVLAPGMKEITFEQ